MAVDNPGWKNLTPFTKDDNRAVEAGKKGSKKGLRHINTWVQELLHDEEFEHYIRDPKAGWIKEKGAPVQAVIKAQIIKALDGDTKAYDSLVKSGWAAKSEIDVTSLGEQVGTVDTKLAAEFAEFIKQKK